MKKVNKLKQQLNDLIKKHGYWSNEVLEFNSSLDHNTMIKINDNSIKR